MKKGRYTWILSNSSSGTFILNVKLKLTAWSAMFGANAMDAVVKVALVIFTLKFGASYQGLAGHSGDAMTDGNTAPADAFDATTRSD